uniref:Uncharacterized protein n=1 Tax=Amphiprion percula TaxID=161767 RepID=A0A3P8T635_AMPPE
IHVSFSLVFILCSFLSHYRVLGAAIKQPIHHRPGIGSKRLTGADFLEMEKILVMNGMSLRKFTFELMASIYHLKNIVFWALVGCFFF